MLSISLTGHNHAIQAPQVVVYPSLPKNFIFKMSNRAECVPTKGNRNSAHIHNNKLRPRAAAREKNGYRAGQRGKRHWEQVEEKKFSVRVRHFGESMRRGMRRGEDRSVGDWRRQVSSGLGQTSGLMRVPDEHWQTRKKALLLSMCLSGNKLGVWCGLVDQSKEEHSLYFLSLCLRRHQLSLRKKKEAGWLWSHGCRYNIHSVKHSVDGASKKQVRAFIFARGCSHFKGARNGFNSCLFNRSCSRERTLK